MEEPTKALPWHGRWTEVDGVKPRHGGQGSVKQVIGKDCGRRGALKEMLSDSVNFSERRQRMKHEVVGLRKVKGDGVPDVYDSNIATAGDEEPLYLVQAWVDGHNLEEFATKPLSIDAALDLVIPLGRIVARCHAYGILHRDIKPENIIVDGCGRPTLVDFGIAWLPPQDRPDDFLTHAGQEMGNRFLRLPEMTAGQLHDDKRSDVTFVVGILFFLLTRKRPRTLAFKDDASPPHRIMLEAFPAATRNDPRISRIYSVFDVGFQVAPNWRFQSVDHLIERLKEIRNPSSESAFDLTQSVARYREMMQKHETAQRHSTLVYMGQVATEFESRLRALSKPHHLVPIMLAGSPRRESDSWIMTGHFSHVTEHGEISASHTIRLEGSEIACISAVDRQQSEYYRGPAADISRLGEEVGKQVEPFFAQVLDGFVRLAENRRTFSDLIQYD
ncbi:hypothetical protein [uncultured Xanthomonas sp.]|uniref:serine/threonine protein kinase n=1 Tax=uncultured Xanthomonas sp. TaxID=152831 RepID=UPI0025F5EE79|nr:hypothetical protein [uncultured Xanthomonas sp.]